MKRHKVTPLQLADLQHGIAVDVLLPESQKDSVDVTGESMHQFDLIYSVDFYDQARPKHLQVFTHGGGAAPVIDVKWSAKKYEPKIEVLLDSSVEVPA